MSFIETRMSDRVAVGFQATASYATLITPLESGQEQRNITRTRAKRRYSAEYANFRRAQFNSLLATFHAVMGSGHSFRFKDWMDFQGDLEPLGNTPGANTTPVQLKKAYTFGSQTTTRTITKPVAGTVTVYQDNGSGVFVAKAGTVSTITGLFTPTTNWTAGRALKASFEFDVPVRFADDELASAYVNKDAISSPCELIEVFGE